MITFLNGTVAEKHPTRVVLDVGGVGYEVFIPLSSFDALPPEGEACRILTHDHIREDAHLLFGFMTDGERTMFTLLMGASGIGPKLALSALSGLSVRELRLAILDGDVKRLTSISGVGKKVAERIIVELRDKIDKGDALEARAGLEPLAPEDLKSRDAVLALVSLGYKQNAAQKMVADAVKGSVGQELDTESLIRKALAK